MFSLLRSRTVFTVTALLVLGVIIGSVHTRALETGERFVLQDVVRTVLSPGNHVFHWVFSVGEQVVRAARPRRSLVRENVRLREQVKQLTRENEALREAAAENVRLRAALQLKEALSHEVIAADVISRRESSWFDTATINRGRNAGIVRGAAVVDPHGWLVGQVLEADTYTAQIVSINDPSSAIGAMTQRSRSTGILQGQGGDYPVLAYLPKDADVKGPDIVMSAGIGRVVPKGFVVGRVVKVVRNSTAGTTAALVRPSVRFDQIEQVFVVKPAQAPGEQ